MNLDQLFKDTFLSELLAVEIIGPNGEIEEGDTIINKMTDLETRLYSLMAKYGRMSDHLKTKIRYENINRDDRKELMTAYVEMKIVSDALNSLMWSLIRIRVGQNSSLGLREDFQIVSYEDSKKGVIDIREVLSGIFGPND